MTLVTESQSFAHTLQGSLRLGFTSNTEVLAGPENVVTQWREQEWHRKEDKNCYHSTPANDLESAQGPSSNLSCRMPWCVVCVLCVVVYFKFRNWGPLQKVCCDADKHARSQLPSGAALSCFRGGAAMCSTAGFLHDGHCHCHGIFISISLHIHSTHTLSHAPQLLPSTTPVSADFVPPPPRVRDWAPVGSCTPLAKRIPSCYQYPLTVGKYCDTGKPPRACPTHVWDAASHVTDDEVHCRAAILSNQTHPQTREALANRKRACGTYT